MGEAYAIDQTATSSTLRSTSIGIFRGNARHSLSPSPLFVTGLILVPAAFALRGATPPDWIAAVSGVGIGAALTLLFNGNKEKNPASG